MLRWVPWFMILVICGLPQLQAQTPAAASAKQAFDQLQKQWVESIMALQQKSQERASSSTEGHSELDHEIEELQTKTEQMVDQIVAAGLAVHKAGLTNDPTVNSTLVAIAGFYVTGDPNGDGGDQYEKALPLIRSMLDGGVGQTSKELWLWGGVSAFCLNEFDLAKRFFDEAAKAGLMGDTPPGSTRGAPINRVWDLAKRQSEALPATRQAWQQEKAIRDRDAAADNLPQVKFHTTRGDILIELFENEAPIATANFLTLVKSGFYDGVVFHRVLPAFMAQGGDPKGTGGGGPGYCIRCECHQPGYRKHFRGSLSMAHAGRDTGGSQFFLTFVPTSYLDGRHTVFGRVVEGMDSAAALRRRNPDPRIPGPLPEPDKIIKAHVVRDRGHEYQFEKLPER